eukprot:4446756-Amphidinium_carterae.1
MLHAMIANPSGNLCTPNMHAILEVLMQRLLVDHEEPMNLGLTNKAFTCNANPCLGQQLRIPPM